MTSGLASFEYEEDGYDRSICHLLETFINGQKIDSLTQLTCTRLESDLVTRFTNSLKNSIRVKDFPQNVKIMTTVIGDKNNLSNMASNKARKVSEFRVKANLKSDKVRFEHKGDPTRLRKQMNILKEKHTTRAAQNVASVDRETLIKAIRI